MTAWIKKAVCPITLVKYTISVKRWVYFLRVFGRNNEFYLFVSLELKRSRHRMKAIQYSKAAFFSINTVWRIFYYSAVFFLYASHSKNLAVCYFTLTKELYMFVMHWMEEICSLALTAPRTLSVKNANIDEKYDNLWY